MYRQLPLGISLPDNITFDNFVVGDNKGLVDMLQTLMQGGLSEQYLYLWGASGVGKTHLLQAISHVATELGLASAYIPLKQADQLDPLLLQDLHMLPLVCIDDVQAIAGHAAWEERLFAVYQRALETKAKVLWSADTVPARLALKLQDLKSRLAASLVLEVQPLEDAEKILALQQRADLRGFELPDNVAHYLLARYPRHMGELLRTLDKLDKGALAEQRALTIPFAKKILENP